MELKLTLKCKPFQAAVSGERNDSYDIRFPSRRLHALLHDSNGNPRTYDTVRFYHGPWFSDTFPQVVMSIDGLPWYTEETVVIPYGYTETITGGCWVIPLGTVLEKN
jgi:hypothetical protein